MVRGASGIRPQGCRRTPTTGRVRPSRRCRRAGTDLLQLINASRAETGAGALSFDAEPSDAAEGHTSCWMLATDSFGRTGEGGSSAAQRAEGRATATAPWGENVAHVGGSDAAVLDAAGVEALHANLTAWPGHGANLLNPAYTEVGIGIEQGDHRGWSAVFVTQVFGSPNAREAAEPDGWFAWTPPASALAERG